ncbi:unnamed protein product, partial [Mucor hiemalis]
GNSMVFPMVTFKIFSKRTFSPNYSTDSLNENTVIKDILVPFLDNTFSNTKKITAHAADKSISSSNSRFRKMDPSLLQQCKKADYSVVHNDSDLSLLVVEAKSYKANSKCKVDLVKMAKYMKEELQEAEKCGNAGVRLIGIMYF